MARGFSTSREQAYDSYVNDFPEPRKVCDCPICTEPIYEGDDVYQIVDELWCESCIRDLRITAEVPEQDEY